VVHLRKHFWRLIVADKSARVGIKGNDRNVTNKDDDKYGKINTTEISRQKTILNAKCIDTMEMEKQKSNYRLTLWK